jgi:hypothetical protein
MKSLTLIPKNRGEQKNQKIKKTRKTNNLKNQTVKKTD